MQTKLNYLTYFTTIYGFTHMYKHHQTDILYKLPFITNKNIFKNEHKLNYKHKPIKK